MKRLLWLATFCGLISCTMHEEYTPPSPIELKPRKTRPSVYDQDVAPDKFGDEGLEPIDIEEEKLEDFDPRIERQKRIEEQAADAGRKKRAGKLTETAKKNIKIERKTASELPVNVAPSKKATPAIKKPEPQPQQPEPPKISENLDLDDLED